MPIAAQALDVWTAFGRERNHVGCVTLFIAFAVFTASIHLFKVLYLLFFHPPRKIPGPFLAKVSSSWQSYHPARQEVMCDFSEDLTTEDIVRRRIRAINRMVALCSRREVPRPKQRLPTFCQDLIKEESPEPELPDPELFPLVCAKTQCPICISDERLTYSSQRFYYKRPSHMIDHIERAHLQKILPGQQIDCYHPVCKSDRLVMHFKNHVARVHEISLRP